MTGQNDIEFKTQLKASDRKELPILNDQRFVDPTQVRSFLEKRRFNLSSLLERLMEPTLQMFNPDEWAADWSDVGFNNYQNLFPFPLVGLNQIW